MGPPCDDAGWRAYSRAIDNLQTYVDSRTRPVLLQVLLRGMKMPSPVVRRELTLLRSRIRDDAINAVVFEDASIRLAQTALDWIRRPHYNSSNHADFAAAKAHIEKVLGRPMPILVQLYREANEKLKRA